MTPKVSSGFEANERSEYLHGLALVALYPSDEIFAGAAPKLTARPEGNLGISLGRHPHAAISLSFADSAIRVMA